jgi:hypothetical protein
MVIPLVLSRLRTWFTMVLSRLYMACGSSPLLRNKSTELPLDHLALGDLGHLVPFVRGSEDVPNFFGAL